MAVVDEVREALEQTVPDFSDRSGDWASVLALAQAGEEDRRARAGASQGRRRRGLIALAAAALVVVVATASAFGTVRDLLQRAARSTSFFSSEGKRGSFSLRIVS